MPRQPECTVGFIGLGRMGAAMARNLLKAGFPLAVYNLDASTEVRAPVPFAGVVRDKLLTAVAQGLGAKDCSAVYEVTRMNAGLK